MSNSAFSKVNIPVPVTVANGGTGATTFTDGGVLIGNGTGAIQVTSAGTSGQVLTSNGAGVDPTFQDAAGGGTINSIQDFRLTLQSGTPVMTTDQTAKTTLYLTPYKGNSIALYNGSSWDLVTSAEVSLSLSGYTSSSNYDIWAYNNSGTLTLESTIWTNSTTRATALAYQNGVLVKSGTTTRRYIGTIRTTGTTGQCEFAFGTRAASGTQAARLNVWNYYNRVNVSARVSDSTSSWSYTTGTWRSANNDTGNRVSFICGVSEDCFSSEYKCVSISRTTGNIVSLDLDGTSVAEGSSGYTGTSDTTWPILATSNARLQTIAPVGFHYIQAVESGNYAASSQFYGDDGSTIRSGLFFKFLM